MRRSAAGRDISALRYLCAAAVALTLAGPASAQVSVRVVDADGRPVPAVRIDVIGSGEVIGVETTSAQGVAVLSGERWSEVRRISLSHLGFQTLIVQAGDIPADGVIRLEPEAMTIEGFTVEAAVLCPIDDDPRARRLWSEVATRYSGDTGARAWLAYLSLSGGAVRQEDVRRTSDVRTVDYVVAGGPGVIHGADHAPRSLDDRISNEGYAWPPLVIEGTTSGRESAWGYPQLDWVHAYHFASPVFGAVHDFAVQTESERQTTLIFCGNGEGTGATIHGTITLVPAERFLSAEWRFETPDPNEGAGGSVTFTAYTEAAGKKPHLLASRGLFYRHSGIPVPYPDRPRTYRRVVTTNIRWYLLPGSELPCNTGLSFYPTRPRTPREIQFARCVADHWGRE